MTKLFPVLWLAVFALASCSSDKDDNPVPAPKYTITVTHEGNGMASANVAEAEEGATIRLTATANDDYKFTGWTVTSGEITLDDATQASTTFTMPATAVSVEAKFVKPVVKYAITVATDGDGTASARVAEAPAGAIISLEAKANEVDGNEFDGWIVVSGDITFDDASAAWTDFIMPEGAVSVKAKFVKKLEVVINGTTWSKFNVDQPGKFTTKVTDSGMLYQWNRKTGWSSTDPRTSSPAGVAWDYTYPTGTTWGTANDPCPVGWRVPTSVEQSELFSGVPKWTDDFNGTGIKGRIFLADNANARLFFRGTVDRIGMSGNLDYSGGYGYYWSGSASPSSADNAWYMQVAGSSPSQSTKNRNFAMSIRCVRK